MRGHKRFVIPALCYQCRTIAQMNKKRSNVNCVLVTIDTTGHNGDGNVLRVFYYLALLDGIQSLRMKPEQTASKRTACAKFSEVCINCQTTMPDDTTAAFASN